LLDGNLHQQTGAFTGDVYVDGNDPDFQKDDAIALLRAIKENGIKKVTGKLVVSSRFSLYCSGSALASGRGLVKIFRNGIDGSGVVIEGPCQAGDMSETSQLLSEHESEALQETLKVMLSRSLNGAAERIGSVVGGVSRLEQIAIDDVGIPASSIHITSASGLGQNRITPKNMMLVLLALGAELKKSGLDYQSILPVAGIDDGTLEKRFTGETERGSVIAKTGTLGQTDGGVSALVGVVRTQKEDLYFVLFGWHGGVSGFRSLQDATIRELQEQRGGPKPFDYQS
ncbi:MAG: D-alanyl-D-alanine carboxypeptidase, partial [Candidatus Obscuribacterales bacterium]|nr:D-alanyl-D-alanine carboxypeptidase [Candidatus Obscuribacterales bacterium]